MYDDFVCNLKMIRLISLMLMMIVIMLVIFDFKADTMRYYIRFPDKF